MKKVVLLTLLGVFLSMSSYAQYNNRNRNRSSYRRSQNYNANRYNLNHYTESGLGVYYGLRLGLSVASVSSDNNNLDYSDGITGLNVGFVAGMQLSYSVPLFLEGGLYYTEKGGKGIYNSQKFTCNLNYLEVPIVVKYQYFLNNDIAIQPFAGGFLACGVGGKIKDYGIRASQNSFSDDNFQRFDGGLRIGCGISFQSIYLDMNYDFGLADIGHGDFDSTHTGAFMVNLGVNF